MIRSGKRLRSILEALPANPAPVLSDRDQRVLRSLRTQGERAVRGRIVTRHRFEARQRPGGVVLVMEVEGRHAMSVAQQLAKRFGIVEDVASAEVTRTERGAQLALIARKK